MNCNPCTQSTNLIQLKFGTGGLRGPMGEGANQINIDTIRNVSQGLANYLFKQARSKKDCSVLIGFDTRKNSRQFAEEVAKVLAGNGIKVYLFSKARAVPLLSFGVRMKGCMAGVMITASHNPANYNGFKVYWSDGGQVVGPHDKGIVDEFSKLTNSSEVKLLEKLTNPLVHLIDEEIDTAYCMLMSSLQNYPLDNRQSGHRLKIVYSSLHGTGHTLVPRFLKGWGFTQLSFVESQIIPDGNFPTVIVPNPEEPETLTLGIEQLKKNQSDILIVTDPDADRVGVAVRHENQIHILNGNQIACLCLEHICNALTKQNRMPEKAAFIKSNVTSELFEEICRGFGKPCFNVNTGFKNFAAKIKEWDQSQEYQFVFGGEESLGFLQGTYVRDKDGISSAALICELALQAKRENKTLVNKLHELYRKYGVYVDIIQSIKYDELNNNAMAKFEKNPPTDINSITIVSIEKHSHTIILRLEDGSKIAIRPSGTEPKFKIYCSVVEKEYQNLEKSEKKAEAKAKALISEIINYFKVV